MSAPRRSPRFRDLSAWLAAALVTVLLLLAAGCAGRRPVPLRPEPVPYADTTPIPEPESRSPAKGRRLADPGISLQVERAWDLRRALGERREALNITRFDDVVSSAWFQHRNGRRRLTPEVVAAGPPGSPPDTTRPITIVAAKKEGVTPGFTVEDARGVGFVLRFDPPGHLHLMSAADAITSRLFHAAGYHVPADHVIRVDTADLRIAPGTRVSTLKDARLMSRRDIRVLLRRTESLPDGEFLALASRWTPGISKGPFFFGGRREDDPNDHYQHQHRRELRGMKVVAAWLNRDDTHFANTLDTYVEPGYLRHYLIDFGASLGSASIDANTPRDGREYHVDVGYIAARLLSLGFWTARWQGREQTDYHPAIGYIPVESFRPGEWKATFPNPAFDAMTVRDGYWGAKLVGSFSDAQIRAAVSAGQLPSAALEDTLAEIISHRRDRTVEYWYSRVTPVEDPSAELVGGDRGPAGRGRGSDAGNREARELVVSFRDLGLEHGLSGARETRYRWRFKHPSRGLEVRGARPAEPDGLQEIRVALPAKARGGGQPGPREALATLRVTAERPASSGRPAVIHLRWRGPGKGYVVAGLEH